MLVRASVMWINSNRDQALGRRHSWLNAHGNQTPTSVCLSFCRACATRSSTVLGVVPRISAALALRFPFQGKQDERGLELMGKPVDGRLQQGKSISLPRLHVGQGAFVGDFHRGPVFRAGRIQRHHALALGPLAALVPRKIERDGVDPSLDRCAWLEGLRLEEYAHERFLNDIARGGLVPQVAEDKIEKRFPVAIDQLIQCRFIARLECLNKRQVGVHGVRGTAPVPVGQGPAAGPLAPGSARRASRRRARWILSASRPCNDALARPRLLRAACKPCPRPWLGRVAGWPRAALQAIRRCLSQKLCSMGSRALCWASVSFNSRWSHSCDAMSSEVTRGL